MVGSSAPLAFISPISTVPQSLHSLVMEHSFEVYKVITRIYNKNLNTDSQHFLIALSYVLSSNLKYATIRDVLLNGSHQCSSSDSESL